MPTEDLLLGLLGPLTDAAGRFATARGWSPWVTEAVLDLVRLAVFAGLAGALVVGGTAALRAIARGGRDELIVRAAAAVVALALFAWIVTHPSPHLHRLVGRWDQIVFAAALGIVLVGLATTWRSVVLALVSLPFLALGTSPTALAVVVAGVTLGWILLVLPVGRGVVPTIAGQAVVLGGVLAVALWVRPADWVLAAHIQGLFAFTLLRHVSMVVDVRRGRQASFADFACFVFFYPGYDGASEVYGEFHDRNLAGDVRYDYRLAARRMLEGAAMVWVVKRIPISLQAVLDAEGFLATWGLSLVLFVHGVLFLMGLWSVIEGVALLYGMRLRPNFPATLLCQNPGQFWRSWRATMTNWLIHYVYMPLGSRRSQVTRIGAAFAVSVAWHWMGPPFRPQPGGPMAYAPIALWGVVNALAVIGYTEWRQHPRQVLPAWVPQPVRTASKIFLTALLGVCSVTFMGFNAGNEDRFPELVRQMVGLG